jgi:hypothetical protein
MRVLSNISSRAEFDGSADRCVSRRIESCGRIDALAGWANSRLDRIISWTGGEGGIVPRITLTLLAAIVATVGLAGGTHAQDSTSTGAAECTVEPYDLTTVLTPTVGSPDAAASPAPAPMERPTGEPADEAIVAAVTETIEMFVGCFNQGYRVRPIFLFTPEYLNIFVVEGLGALMAEQIQQLNDLAATEEPSGPLPPDEQTVIVSIEDVEVLDDGRVVATVIGDSLAEEEGPSPVYFIFKEVDGRYLIDGVIDPETDEASPEP